MMDYDITEQEKDWFYRGRCWHYQCLCYGWLHRSSVTIVVPSSNLGLARKTTVVGFGFSGFSRFSQFNPINILHFSIPLFMSFHILFHAILHLIHGLDTVQSTIASSMNAIRNVFMNYVMRDCIDLPFICRWGGVLIPSLLNDFHCRYPLQWNLSLLLICYGIDHRLFPRTHPPGS